MKRLSSARAATALALAGLLAAPACESDNALVLADAEHAEEAAEATHELLEQRAEGLYDAVEALCALAPAPAPGGWVHPRDTDAIKAMRAAWLDARRAYDRLEGVMFLLPPELVSGVDGRYEDAIAEGPDPDLFDNRGFVGLHAVERVLWAKSIPAPVAGFESSLEGYVPAAYPADEAEAERFRKGLCARLAADTHLMEEWVESLSLDFKLAYTVVDKLVDAQADKVHDAGEGHEVSRYSGFTLADLRENLAAARETHALFRPWLATKGDGPHVDEEIEEAMSRLDKRYTAFGTDSLPFVPEDWSNEAFTHEASTSGFGALFLAVSQETDASIDGSLLHGVLEASELIGADLE